MTTRDSKRTPLAASLAGCLCLLLSPTLVFAQVSGDALDEAVTMPPSEPSDSTPSPNTVTTTGPSQGPSDLNSYLPSGDRPIVGGQNPDSFDLNRGSSGGGTVVLSGAGTDELYGAPDPGSVTQADKKPLGPVPEFHIVKKGDTLFQISNGYYGDGHHWPKLWSMNPQVENPHWIYPGDQLRTGGAGTAPQAASSQLAVAGDPSGRRGFVGGVRTVPSGTIFLRDQGFLGDPSRDDWGELVGAKEERMILTEGDTVFLIIKKGIDLRIGQRLNLFRPVRPSPRVPGARRPPGAVVKVFGTVRIDGWDRKERIAKGTLIESVDGVERGARVGPVGRRFDIVPPKKARVGVQARVLSGLHPLVYHGGQQVVFIDRGRDDGLVPGNRLRVIRRGDAWRRHLKRGAKAQRTRVEMESDEQAPGEKTPLHGNDEKFPDEVVGEITVLRTEEYSAICLVSETHLELEAGDRAVSTVGY